MEALANGGGLFLVGRTVESVGYLAVIVSAPVLMAVEAKRLGSSLALVLWSAFLPLGFTIGSVFSGIVGDALGWRVPLLVWALVAPVLVLTYATGSSSKEIHGNGSDRGRPSKGSIVLAFAFGCFTCFQVGIFALYPLYLVETKGSTATFAGVVTGIGGFVTISGILVPFYFAKMHPGRQLRMSPQMLFGSLLLPAVLLFPTLNASASASASAAFFIALNIASGMLPALVFSSIPRFSGSCGIASANGAVAQTGALGSLIGPPAFAFTAYHMGWTNAATLGFAISMLALLVLHVLERQTSSNVEA